MSRKQRVLKGLRTVESGLRQAANNGSRETLAAVSQNLTATRDVCRQGLPENSYAKYGEVYDGLILATQQMAGSATLSLEEDALALCQELLRYLIQETEGEKSFKKDIFFLPYKASMWDSLESVWKAAYEDKEHCNAYVMPIPYADLNPDRSVAEWHCERGAFPKYVPTLDWQQVDLKEWHPDVIFYHNPYDDCNHVTSVESRYYSGKLKECADKLVYIPYFVLEEPHPGNEAEEESISHFVLNPGVLNADQVIVQSEAMREVYINVLIKNTNQKDRSYWEARISGAGSPKIDKVLTSRKEDFEMPEAWRKLAEGRKVILYNTSLNAMLQNTDKVCDKLRYVFDVFRDRKDVVLWWRPHPLMKSTLHSMRPQFEEEYLRLEKEYIEEGWGIYDDSPDLHRAICWSDGYYGDSSSVLDLYRKTGKPIVRAIYYRNSILIYYGKCVVVENMLYYVPEYYPVIVALDIVSAVIRKVIPIPLSMKHFNQYDGYRNGWRNIEVLDDSLYIMPFSNNRIVKYNLETEEFDFVLIPDDVMSLEEKYYNSDFPFGFYGSHTYHHFIYMYGFAPIILCYDTKKKSFETYKNFPLNKIPKMNQWFTRNGIIVDDCLFLPLEGYLAILEWDISLQKGELHIFEGNIDGIQFGAIGFDGKFFWLTVVGSNKIAKWEKSMKRIDMYQFCPEMIHDNQPYFSNVICGSKDIWFIPYHGDKVLVLNKNGNFKTDDRFLVERLKDLDNPFQANYIGMAGRQDVRYFFIHAGLGSLLSVDLALNTVREKNVRVSCNVYRYPLEDINRENKVPRQMDTWYDFWVMPNKDEVESSFKIVGDDIYHLIYS